MSRYGDRTVIFALTVVPKGSLGLAGAANATRLSDFLCVPHAVGCLQGTTDKTAFDTGKQQISTRS